MRYVHVTLMAVIVLVVAQCEANMTGPLDELPRELTVAERELVGSNNRFALKLFDEINRQAPGENLFVSPLSVSMALGMTYNGTDGETKAQMEDVLAFTGMSVREINEAYRDLTGLLFSLDDQVEFNLANSIWHREGFAVEQAFLDVNREYFDARVSALDFDDPTAASIINGWVSDQTHGKIDKIVPEQIGRFVMFLINAMYFKASWASQFDKSLTRDHTFTLEDGSTRMVPMMTHGGPVPVRTSSGPDHVALDLPYSRGAFSMTVILPEGGGSVDALVGSLDDARLAAIAEGLTASEIEVELPKFSLEYEIELNDVLIALGMPDAFDGSRADFSKMRSSGGLYIDHVKHKTFVQVDEEGTEAAAVTSVGIVETSVPPVFRVDRPFVFVIRENLSGTVLFMGKILSP